MRYTFQFHSQFSGNGRVFKVTDYCSEDYFSDAALQRASRGLQISFGNQLTDEFLNFDFLIFFLSGVSLVLDSDSMLMGENY